MCGIFGVIGQKSSEDLMDLMFFGLLEIQHRGHDAAGIAYSDGEKVRVEKTLGLVSNFFNEKEEKIRADHPLLAIGHVRYPTKGPSSLLNAQPHYLETLAGRYAICSNGDVPRLEQQKQEFRMNGVDFYTDNDAEFLLRKITYLSNGENLEEGIARMIKSTCATYSSAFLTKNKVFLFRDPWGNRPLVYGKKENFVIFASESCALNKIGIKKENQKEVEPGEIVSIDTLGNIQHIQVINLSEKAHCVFELIYFARPDSIVFGREVGSFRTLLGKRLAQEHLAICDFVSAVPDSGNFAGIGYAVAAGFPFRMLLVKNSYIPRTFISSDRKRKKMVRLKYSVMETLLKKWKKVFLIDDSIVRGSTNQELVKMILEAGAEEVRLGSSCPPVIGPCYFGIDTPTHEELIANQIAKDGKPDIEGIARKLHAKTLGYLSLEALKETIVKIGQKPENFCLACFDRNYKINSEALATPC